jgi:putative transposase
MEGDTAECLQVGCNSAVSNGTASHGIDFPIGMMCRLLKVSRSGYYAWLERPEANRTKENKILSEHIQQIHADSGQIHGSPRIQAALIEKGFTPCRQRVVELMKNLNIKARRKRRFQVTTDSQHVLPIADNILNRKFTATEPDQAWVADITYIDTHQGWLYLAVVVDLFSRKVVGWSMADHNGDRPCPHSISKAQAKALGDFLRVSPTLFL